MNTQIRRLLNVSLTGALAFGQAPRTAYATPRALAAADDPADDSEPAEESPTPANVVTVSGATQGNGNYASLKAAFDAIGSSPATVALTGNVTVTPDAPVSVKSAVTLELSEFTIEGATGEGEATYLFDLEAGAVLTVVGPGKVDTKIEKFTSVFRVSADNTGAYGRAVLLSGTFAGTVFAKAENVPSSASDLVALRGGVYDSLEKARACYIDPQSYEAVEVEGGAATVRHRRAEDGVESAFAQVNGWDCYNMGEVASRIAALSAGTPAKVALVRDAEVSTPLSVSNRAVEIDTAGHALTWKAGSTTSAAISVSGSGMLTVSGTGSITTGDYATLISNAATVALKEATLANTKSLGTVVSTSTGTVNLASGALSSASNAIVVTGGLVTVTGGSVSSDTSAAMEVSAGTVQVSAGELKASVGDALKVGGGTVKLSGGTVSAAAGTALAVSSGGSRPSVTVSGTAALTGETAIQSTVSGSAASPGVSVEGGSVVGAVRGSGAGSIVIHEGTFDARAAQTVPTYLSDDSIFDASTGRASVVSGTTIFDRMVTVELPAEGYVYDGKPKTPAVSVARANEKLAAGVDYAVKYADNVNAGTATVEVTGAGAWSGVGKRTFVILPQPVETPTVEFGGEVTYAEGVAITAVPTVRVGATTLSPTSDFSVTYEPNEAGTEAEATLTFTGNYSGTATKTVKLASGYKVSFVDGVDRGVTLAEFAVARGASIAEGDVPEPLEHVGYLFAGWSAGHAKIAAPTKIYATYVRLAAGAVAEPVSATTGDMASATLVTEPDGTTTMYLVDEDGTASEGWRYVGGAWRFARAGVGKDGLVQDGDTTYYLGDDGVMRTGWQVGANGERFFCLPSGAVGKNGWIWDGSGWYWADANGTIKTGWHWVGGAWYWLNPSGVIPGRMQTGWVWDGSAWYWCDATGVMIRNTLIRDGAAWYCLGAGGDMQYGWRFVGGVWRYFGASGAMLVSTVTPDGFAVGPDGRWLYA